MTSRKSGDRNTIVGAVYNTIKESIASLRLPPGTVMSTQEMATKLNVSRTPVREAFIRLEKEDLVYIIPQKETVVTKINLNRVKEERFLRESLELAVVDPFMEKCKNSHIHQLKENVEEQWECFRKQDYAGFVKKDNEFHKLFFYVADQKLSWETINNVISHYNRIRVLTVHSEEVMKGSVEQHEKIVMLLEQKREQELKAELSSHVKKIFGEEKKLIEMFPDYFETGEEHNPFEIGSL